MFFRTLLSADDRLAVFPASGTAWSRWRNRHSYRSTRIKVAPPLLAYTAKVDIKQSDFTYLRHSKSLLVREICRVTLTLEKTQPQIEAI